MDSLIAQTYQDWEAILVDDGSTDQSGQIADEYAGKDRRFHVIHKENGGQSAARNQALTEATGKWIMYLDSDDFLHPQAIELCVEAAERDGSDIVTFTYDRKYRTLNLIRHFIGLGDSKPHFVQYHNPQYLVTDNIFDYATERPIPKGIERRWVIKHCQAWRCLYAKRVVENCRFPSGIMYEDFPWWGAVMLNVKRATILNFPLYYYYPNKTSDIFSKSQEKRIHSLREALRLAKHIYSEAPEDIKEAWERNFIMPFQKKLEKKGGI